MRYLKLETARCDFTEKWDVFVSAYNGARRVRDAFDAANAATKRWVAIPEYAYSVEECDEIGNCLRIEDGSDESQVINAIWSDLGLTDGDQRRICIDITGFMRPQILYVVKHLRDHGIRRYDVMYTEPEQYKQKENTAFAGPEIVGVRQVIGFEGSHIDDVSADVLMVGVGYDDALISRVINEKDGARVVQLLGLPSLSADMYQESILRFDRVGSACDLDSDDVVMFAPANDPFVVASELNWKLVELRSRGKVTNIYLSPLATKVQALGFAIFYLDELTGEPASVLFPFTKSYARETSTGTGRTWIYRLE